MRRRRGGVAVQRQARQARQGFHRGAIELQRPRETLLRLGKLRPEILLPARAGASARPRERRRPGRRRPHGQVERHLQTREVRLDENRHALGRLPDLEGHLHRRARSDRTGRLGEGPRAIRRPHFGLFPGAGPENPQAELAARARRVHGHIAVGVGESAQAPHRVPPLPPCRDLVRIEPPHVYLSGQGAGLDFVVGTVVVGEVHLVHRAVAAVAPRPGLLAGNQPVIGVGHDPAVRLLIVGAEKILVAPVGEDRGGILVSSAEAQIPPLGDRPGVERRPGVVGAQRHGINEAEARRVGHRRTVPEVIGPDRLGAVVEADALLEERAPRPQRHDHGPARPVDALHLPHGDGAGAVRLRRQNLDIDGLDRAHGVSRGPRVELDPARHPGAALADQPRLDHAIHVEDRRARRLVEDVEDLPPQLGQESDAQVFVLQDHGLPDPRGFRPRQVVQHGVRIDVLLVGGAEVRMRHGRHPRIRGNIQGARVGRYRRRFGGADRRRQKRRAQKENPPNRPLRLPHGP